MLPPLHVKSGLLKQFLKAVDVKRKAVKEIRKMFPKLSNVKVKRGIFVGSQIATMLKSKKLKNKMRFRVKDAWQFFRGARKDMTAIEEILITDNWLKD